MTHGEARREDEPGSSADATGDGLRADRPLWRQRDFGILWAAQTLSVLGDSFALIALPLLVLEATEVTPEHLLGRVTSAFWTLQYAAAPIGAAVLTWAAEERGTTPVALVAGATCVALAATALLTPIRGPGRTVSR